MDADLMILAGDIHIGSQGIKWARANLPDRPVVYVPGNHEYYGKAYPNLIAKLEKEAEGSQVFVLENKKVKLGNIIILGCSNKPLALT